MNIFSIGLAFSAVKLPCREMNNMGFGLAFWEAHPPHAKPISLIYFCQLHSSTSGTCSHIFPLTHFPCSIFFLAFSCLSLSQYALSGLVCMARGKEGRGLVWIIHISNIMHQPNRDPADACPPDSLLLSLLPLFTCTSCIRGFSIVYLFSVWFNNCMITVLIVQGVCLPFCCNQQECS